MLRTAADEPLVIDSVLPNGVTLCFVIINCSYFGLAKYAGTACGYVHVRGRDLTFIGWITLFDCWGCRTMKARCTVSLISCPPLNLSLHKSEIFCCGTAKLFVEKHFSNHMAYICFPIHVMSYWTKSATEELRIVLIWKLAVGRVNFWGRLVLITNILTNDIFSEIPRGVCRTMDSHRYFYFYLAKTDEHKWKYG
jgi:hypothetical protein